MKTIAVLALWTALAAIPANASVIVVQPHAKEFANQDGRINQSDPERRAGTVLLLGTLGLVGCITGVLLAIWLFSQSSLGSLIFIASLLISLIAVITGDILLRRDGDILSRRARTKARLGKFFGLGVLIAFGIWSLIGLVFLLFFFLG